MLEKIFTPHSGKEIESIIGLAPTPDVIHVGKEEDDIWDCIGVCSGNPQYLKEAHQRRNGKTITSDISLNNTLKNKL